MSNTPKAFMTGSRVYGEPREDSDVDLVVLMDASQLKELKKFADSVEAGKFQTSDAAGEMSEGSLKFGKLNIIAVTREDQFNAWRQGTIEIIELMENIGPVTREQAKKILRRHTGQG